MRQIAGQERARLDAGTAAELRDSAGHIGAMIDRELKRAWLAGATTVSALICRWNLPDLLDVIRKLCGHKGLACELVAPAVKIFLGDREDLIELFGNLLDNAAKWATSRGWVLVADARGLTFSVEDDGAGLDDEQIRQLTERGASFDESTPGTVWDPRLSRRLSSNIKAISTLFVQHAGVACGLTYGCLISMAKIRLESDGNQPASTRRFFGDERLTE